MCKISVIIPVYNSEKYIERCLKSLINQTFKDIEIICVDDCGTDNSMQIVERYAKKDSRIKIIRNSKNLKLGKTREAGFFSAKGEYVTFVDSDDECDLFFLEKLYKKAIETNADVVKANVKIIAPDGNVTILPANEEIKRNQKNNIPLILIGQDAPWSFLLKRSFILENKIMPDNFDGDCCIGGRIMYHAQNLITLDDAYYYYYYAQTSSFSGEKNINSLNIRLSMFTNKINMLNSFNVDTETYVLYVKKHISDVYRNIIYIFHNYETNYILNTIETFYSMLDLLKLSQETIEKEIYSCFNNRYLLKGIRSRNPKTIMAYLKRTKFDNDILKKIVKVCPFAFIKNIVASKINHSYGFCTPNRRNNDTF